MGGLGEVLPTARYLSSMTALSLITALEIITRHDSGASVYAEHDQIWVGDSDLPLTPDERAVLDGLGWFEDEDSWTHFT